MEDAVVDKTKEAVAALRRLAVKQARVTKSIAAQQTRMASFLARQGALDLTLAKRLKKLEAKVARLSA
jgi:heterodisulfide reductase subunit C